MKKNRKFYDIELIDHDDYPEGVWRVYGLFNNEIGFLCDTEEEAERLLSQLEGNHQEYLRSLN